LACLGWWRHGSPELVAARVYGGERMGREGTAYLVGSGSGAEAEQRRRPVAERRRPVAEQRRRWQKFGSLTASRFELSGALT